MVRKSFSTLLIAFMLALPVSAGIFSGYDFTYTNSVGPSTIGVFDATRMGVDITGYGYLGDMTSGIFLRLGIQSPYTTIFKLFSDGSEGAESEVEIADDMLEFKVLFAFGPAFRRKVSPTLSWYMGSGIKVEQDRTMMAPGVRSEARGSSRTDNSVGFDLDLGFRLSAHEHSTLRIGIYCTRPLFILTEESNGKDESVFTFTQNIFAPRTGALPFDACGYISLGHTYTNGRGKDVWAYSTTSSEFGKGITEKIK